MKKIPLAAKIVCGAVVLAVLAFAILILVLTVTEFRPKAVEAVALAGQAGSPVPRGLELEIFTWNIGYAALDAAQDFCMDGGKGVRPAQEGIVEQNVWAIQAFLASSGAEFVFLQEADVKSRRSYNIDEVGYFSSNWKGQAAFTANYRCLFVPYPVPRFMGGVHSGLLTLSTYAAENAERLALPVAFSWPTRLAQLKRCLLVERLPAEGGGELVLVNLHLEAYDSGEGKAAQTRVLVDFLASEFAKGNFVVAGGDFNQLFPGAEAAFPITEGRGNFVPGALDAGILPGWTFAADTAAPSCRLLNRPYTDRANHQFYIIDGFIVSPNVKIDSVETVDLDFRNSDHNPVKLTFILD